MAGKGGGHINPDYKRLIWVLSQNKIPTDLTVEGTLQKLVARLLDKTDWLVGTVYWVQRMMKTLQPYLNQNRIIKKPNVKLQLYAFGITEGENRVDVIYPELQRIARERGMLGAGEELRAGGVIQDAARITPPSSPKVPKADEGGPFSPEAETRSPPPQPSEEEERFLQIIGILEEYVKRGEGGKSFEDVIHDSDLQFLKQTTKNPFNKYKRIDKILNGILKPYAQRQGWI
jgi:hypothetical protein